MIEKSSLKIFYRLIRLYNFEITEQSFYRKIITHPDSPTLKSISDSFDEWSIVHEVLKIPTGDIPQFETAFLAHTVNDDWILVTKISENKILFQDKNGKRKVMSIDVFKKIWTNIILKINPSPLVRDKSYKDEVQTQNVFKTLFIFSVISVLLIINGCYWGMFSIAKFKGLRLILLITKQIGVIVSFVLLLSEHRKNVKLPFCVVGDRLDCEKVSSSSFSKIYSTITLSDLSFVYFLSTLIFVLNPLVKNEVGLGIISFSTIPFILISTYYQFFKLKKACIFCIAIQVILITEFFLYGYYNKQLHALIYSDLIRLAITINIISLLYVAVKFSLEKLKKLENLSIHYLSTKKKPDVVKTLIKENVLKLSNNDEILYFGNRKSTMQINIFISLSCPSCAKMILELTEEQEVNDICFGIAILPSKDMKSMITIHHIYYLYDNKGWEYCLLFIKKWFSDAHVNEDYVNNYNEIENVIDLKNKARLLLELFNANNIRKLPALYVNRAYLPAEYSISDIKYISNLINLS